MEITKAKKDKTFEISISMTNEELAIFEAIVPDAFEWIKTAVNHRLNKCIDIVYEETSDFKADKKSNEDKLLHLSTQTLKSRKQKDQEDLDAMVKQMEGKG